MPIEVTDLSTLDPADVQQQTGELTQRLQELLPPLDLRQGAVQRLVLQLVGLLATTTTENINRWRQSRSFSAILADPTLADTEIVDDLFSFYRVTRQEALAAQGTLVIVINNMQPVTLGAGAVFVGNGIEFETTTPVAARTTTAAVTAATDRLLQPLGDGTYAFTAPVVARTPGTAGMLRRGAALTTEVPIPQLVRVYAQSDFTGGVDAAANEDMHDALLQGAAAKAWSNRVTIDALLRHQEEFAQILQTSIVGFGDPEMLRYHSIVPVAFGGRVDLYARTQALPQLQALSVTATLVEKSADGGIWQFSLDRDAAPGFYDIQRITLPSATDAGTYTITQETRGYNLDEDLYFPDITSATEAAYTRYQTTTVRFLDSDTPVTGLTEFSSTQTYTTLVRSMPLIAELQDFCLQRSVTAPAGDVLVRAPVPCTLTLACRIQKRSGQTDPDLDVLRNALAQHVNTRGFLGALYASDLLAILHAELLSGMAVSDMDLFGQIRRPDGTLVYLRSREVLQIPNDPEHLVSGRTVVFLLDPQDVDITVHTVEVPDV